MQRKLVLIDVSSCLLLFMLSIVIASCTSGTAPKTTSVRARVVLEGMDDHQAVSVFLYQADIVDDELLAVNTQFPSLGFPLRDQHLFDHREYAPVYTTTTSSDGSFEVKGVERDKYILVLLKEGFGPHYLFDLDLNSDIVEANNGEDITLFEVIELPQYVDGEFVFESGKTYVSYSDVTFLPGSSALFQGRSTLLIQPGGGVTIHGTADFAGSSQDQIRISSSDGYYMPLKAASQFAKVELSALSSVEEINGLVLNLSSDGLIVQTSDTQVHESVFNKSNIGCQLLAGRNLQVRNSYFLNSIGVVREGLSLYDVSDIVIDESVFFDIGRTALSIYIGRGVLVTNCFFSGGTNHILNRYSSQTVVSHSTFINGQNNLTNTARSTLDIQYNDIEGRVCIYTYHTGNQGNSISNGWTKANFNNLNASQYTVHATAQFYTYQHEYVPLDFRNNYWGTEDQSTIDESIIDFNDLEPYPDPGNIWPLIEFIPYRNSRVVNAGIQ